MKNIAYMLIIGVVSFLHSCGSDTQNSQPILDNSYSVINPKIIDTTYYDEYVADIDAKNNVEIRTRVKGFLEGIHVDEGQVVEKNQLLFSISKQEYQEELYKAKAGYKSAIANLKTAELGFRNSELLYENDVIAITEVEMSRAELAAAQSVVEMARAQESFAQLNLSYTKIRAPFEGKINRIRYKVGSIVDESSLMTTLSDDSEVFTYFNVSEREYFDLIRQDSLIAQNVILILANGEEHSEPGKIETIESEFDRVTGSLFFRARFKNPDGIIRHGATGKIKFFKELKDAMIIPQKSTFEIQDKVFVYVIDDQENVQMKSFVPQMRLPHLYVVKEGLTTSDRVVYEGIQDIKPGQKLNTRKLNFPSFFTSN